MAEITRRHVLLGGVGLAALSISGSFEVDAADDDLASYADLLERYVVQSDDGINRVDYSAWHASSKNRQELDAFIANQSRLTPSAMNPSERFAFWTNLYNALTLAVILDAYPVRSIKDIKSKGRLFDLKGFLGPWRTKLVTVEGHRMSLDDIEHGTMRPEFRDPRIHYAVNCASIGCPNLLTRPWKASSLEADLDDAARAYINHSRGVTVRSDGALKVSSLYRWYAEDFGSTDANVIDHLRRYAREPLAAKLAAATRIAADDYDWSLNDARRLN